MTMANYLAPIDLEDDKLSISVIKKTVEMATGNRYRFGATTFEADFISHDLLSRMLPYKENDPFSPRVLVELRQSLLSSDYFRNVEIVTGTPEQDSLIIPIRVVLQQRVKNKYGIGAGYGTDTGLRGSLEWTSRLLNRFGHQFTLQLQPSERKSYFGGVYTIPIRDPRKDRLSLLGKWETEQFENRR